MSKINQGILGGFSGRTGSVVGSSWKGKAIMRARPQFKKDRQPTPGQLAQREKFALMVNFLSGLADLFAVTFKRQANGITAFNAAVSLNIKTAIAGTASPYSIDHSQLQFGNANSAMPNANKLVVAAEAGQQAKFTWGDNSGVGRAKGTDSAIVVVFSSVHQQCVSIETNGLRSAGETTIDISLFAGETVETWVLFLSDDKTSVSKTAYTGQVTLIP